MSGPTEHDDEESTGQPQPGSAAPVRLRFDGVALVGSIEQGTSTVEDLTLLIDEQAVNIFSRQPPDKRSVPWSAITYVWFGPTGADSTGRITTPLDISSANRTVRFFLYGDRVDEGQISQLRSWLPVWQGGAPPRPPSPDPFTAPPPPLRLRTAAAPSPPPPSPPPFHPLAPPGGRRPRSGSSAGALSMARTQPPPSGSH